MAFLDWRERDPLTGAFSEDTLAGRWANAFIGGFCSATVFNPALYLASDGPGEISPRAYLSGPMRYSIAWEACRFAGGIPQPDVYDAPVFSGAGGCTIRVKTEWIFLATQLPFEEELFLGECDPDFPELAIGLPQGIPVLVEDPAIPGAFRIQVPTLRTGVTGAITPLSGSFDSTIARFSRILEYEVTPCPFTPAVPGAITPIINVPVDVDINAPITVPVDISVPVSVDANVNALIPFTLIRPTAEFNLSPEFVFRPVFNGTIAPTLAPTVTIGLGGVTIGGGPSVTIDDLINVRIGGGGDGPGGDCPDVDDIKDGLLRHFRPQVLQPDSRVQQILVTNFAGGTVDLPQNTVFVRVQDVTATGQMRSQAGSGSAANVFFAGWVSFTNIEGSNGERIPLNFQDASFEVPLNASQFTVSLNFDATCNIIAEYESGYYS